MASKGLASEHLLRMTSSVSQSVCQSVSYLIALSGICLLKTCRSNHMLFIMPMSHYDACVAPGFVVLPCLLQSKCTGVPCMRGSWHLSLSFVELGDGSGYCCPIAQPMHQQQALQSNFTLQPGTPPDKLLPTAKAAVPNYFVLDGQLAA